MSRDRLGRAAKVVSVEVGRKRTCRELSMEMTPAARADHSRTTKRLVLPADERLDPIWHKSELLMEPHESFALGGVHPQVMKQCVDGYRAAFTNSTMKQHVCSVCSQLHFARNSYELSVFSFCKVFTGLLVPVGDVAEVVAEQYVTVTLGEGTVVRVLSWVKEALLESGVATDVEKNIFGLYLDGALFDTDGVEADTSGNLWFHVCGDCFKSGETSKTPQFAVSRCWIGDVPDELKGLTICEQKLISKVVLRAEMIVLRGSGSVDTRQRGLKGNVISFPVDVDSTKRAIESLPHSLEYLSEVITVQYYGKNFEGDKLLVARVMQVRRARVEAALVWLKLHNRRYKDVVIDGEALQALPVEGIPQSFIDSSVLMIDPRDVSEAEASDAERSSYVPAAGKAVSLDDVVLEASGFTDMGGNSVDCSTLRNSAMENLVLMAGSGLQPVNEFSELDRIMCEGFPTLYPYGVGGVGKAGRYTASVRAYARNVMNSKHRRFAAHHLFSFVLVNIIQRRAVVKNARFAVDARRMSAGEVEQIRSVTSQQLDLLLAAVKAGTDPSVALKQSPDNVQQLFKSLKVVSRNIPGSPLMRGVEIKKVMAMMHTHSTFHLFATMNPNDWTNPVIMKLSTGQGDLDVPVPQFMRGMNCMKVVSENPNVAAKVFHLIVEAFIRYILRYGHPDGGAFGQVSAYFLASEGQERGTLHGHMVIWLRGGGTSAGFLKAMKERPGFEEGFRLFHDSIVRSVWDVRGQTTVPDVCGCTPDAQVDGRCSCVVCQPVQSQGRTEDSSASAAGICVGAETGVTHHDSDESSMGDSSDGDVKQSADDHVSSPQLSSMYDSSDDGEKTLCVDSKCVDAETHHDSDESSMGESSDQEVTQSADASSPQLPAMDDSSVDEGKQCCGDSKCVDGCHGEKSTTKHRKPVHVFSERAPVLELPLDAGEKDLKQFLQVLKVEANRVAVISQVHKHSFTCFKKKTCTCRFSFPKMVHELTHLIEETQALVGRRDCKWINSFNDVITVALRCNNDVKYLLSSLDCKNIMVYVASYLTKKQLSMHALFSFARGTYDSASKRLIDELGMVVGPQDVSRRLLTRAVMKALGNQELQAPSIQQFLLGLPSHYWSHEFVTVPLGLASSFARSQLLLESTPMGGIVSARTGTGATSINALIDYMYRPLDEFWINMSLLEFLIYRNKILRPHKSTESQKFLKLVVAYGHHESGVRRKLRGRPGITRYEFHPNHPQHSTHYLTKAARDDRIPMLSGGSVPRRSVIDELYCMTVVLLCLPWYYDTFDLMRGKSWCAIYNELINDAGLLAGRMDNSCDASSVAENVHCSNEYDSVERTADAGVDENESLDDDLDSVPDEVDSCRDESDSDSSENGDAAPQSVSASVMVSKAPTERIQSYVRTSGGDVIASVMWQPVVPSREVPSSKFVLLRKRLLSQRNVNFLNNCQQLHVMDASRSADLIARGERERQYGNLGATNQTESGNLDAEAEFNADGMIGLLAAIAAEDGTAVSTRQDKMDSYVNEGLSTIVGAAHMGSVAQIEGGVPSSAGIRCKTSSDESIVQRSIIQLEELRKSGIPVESEDVSDATPAASPFHTASLFNTPTLMSPPEFGRMKNLNKLQLAVFVPWVTEAKRIIMLYEAGDESSIVGDSFLMSGQGGSGKSYVIQCIVEYFALAGWMSYLRVCALTGTAAANLEVHGCTLDSLLKIRRGKGGGSDRAEWLRGVLFLIVDEFSMLGLEKMRNVIAKLKSSSPTSTSPTGNISVLFSGDPLQFEPVGGTSVNSRIRALDGVNFVPSEEHASCLISSTYWKGIRRVVVLKTNYRSQGDVSFSDMLVQMRRTGLTHEMCMEIRKRIITAAQWRYPPLSIPSTRLLVSRNAIRTSASKMLTRMDAKNEGASLVEFESMDLLHGSGGVPLNPAVSAFLRRNEKASDCPNLDQASAFYAGQAVILTKNMGPEIGVANGSVGIVTSIVMEPGGEDGGEFGSRVPLYIHVKFPGLTVKLADELEPGVVPISRMSVTCKHKSKQMSTPFVWERVGFPLVAARCSTDYKAQGLGFNYVVVDLVKPPGGRNHVLHVYVMLSRCKTWDGLHILRNFSDDDVMGCLPASMMAEYNRLQQLSDIYVNSLVA